MFFRFRSRMLLNTRAMKITLTKDLEKFVSAKVRSGGYADAREVVREALRTFRSKDDPAETDSEELADLLLPAVRGKHRPLTAQHFDRLRQRARRAGACSIESKGV
jgi:putative addiction module CopG family antidote